MYTGKCKCTGGYYNDQVQAQFCTGVGVNGGKDNKNLYLLTLCFLYKLAFILFVMTPDTHTVGKIAVKMRAAKAHLHIRHRSNTHMVLA